MKIRKQRKTINKLTMYRRHRAKCPSKKSKSLTACDCPLWAHGRRPGERKRGRWPLNTAALGTGENRMLAMLRPQPDDDPGGGIKLVKPSAQPTLAEGEALFLADGRARIENNRLTQGSLHLYSKSIRAFRAFAEVKGFTLMRDISEEVIAEWLNANPTWAARTIRNHVMFLRVWLEKAAEKKWIPACPIARGTDLIPAVPTYAREALQPDEIKRVLELIPSVPFLRAGAPPEQRQQGVARLRAAVLVMLYTGLRISDITFLERESIQGNVLDVVTIKNGERLRSPIALPPVVIEALAALAASRVYFFVPDRADDYAEARAALRNGGDFIGIIGRAFVGTQRARLTEQIHKLFTLAGIEGGAHRLRHTFAIAHLDGGGSVYDLRNMLGHSSVVITEKYLALAKSYRKPTRPALHYELPAA